METTLLSQITIRYGENEFQTLSFEKAELVTVTQFGDKIWYVDVDGISDAGLLAWFGQSENIRVELRATAQSGDIWEGTAYFHPNEPSRAAAIRGDGELTAVRA